MNEPLKLTLPGDRTRFKPGEEIEVDVQWELTAPPRSFVVRLLWVTRGKGDTDQSVAQSIPIPDAGQFGTRRVTLSLPGSPYSFSGKLISLLWAIETVAEPKLGSQRLDIAMSPTGEEILLHGAHSSVE